MALWLLRGGVHGEDVQRFLDENRVWVNWLNCVDQDLGLVDSKPDMRKLLKNALPEKTKMGVANVLGMFWCFVKKMKPGDWVIVPHKGKPAMNIAEITSDYIFDPKANDPPRHYRNVKWIETDIPRSNFDQDLLYSLGGFRSIYEIKRNDAERRVRGMTKAGWKSSVVPAITDETGEDESIDELPDLERLARDQLAKLIDRRFKGHGLASLVEAILRAQGYTTYISPPGPDKGVDILAAPGPLGFGQPRLCVQVKSSDSPVDTSTLNQLIGTMQNVHAAQGLLVSWGGFKSSVDKEVPPQFFRVRLWNQDTLIDEMLSVYDRLDPDLRADIPLKQIWTVTATETEE